VVLVACLTESIRFDQDRIQRKRAVISDLKISAYFPWSVLEQRAYRFHIGRRCPHPSYPSVEIKRESPAGLFSRLKSRLRKDGIPFGQRVVPDV